MELHIGKAINRGALTVFPVWNGAGGRRRYRTDMGAVTVAEMEGGPSVPGISAVNGRDKAVLVLEGQLFEGVAAPDGRAVGPADAGATGDRRRRLRRAGPLER